MGAASFAKGGTTLTFARAPQRPQQSRELGQSEERSTGGSRFGGAIYTDDTLMPLAWQGMSAADLAALLTFFDESAGGMAETFVYTDTNGTAHTVRFAAPRIDHRESAYGRHEVNLTLRRED